MHRTLFVLFCVTGTLTAPVTAHAETQLERLESLSELMNAAMADVMIREVVKNGGNPAPLRNAMPDFTWDAKYRAAGECVLDRMVNLAGPEAVDTMLDKMERLVPEIATADIETMADDFDILPASITQEQSIQMNSECGITSLALDRMDASGFTAALMKSMSGN